MSLWVDAVGASRPTSRSRAPSCWSTAGGSCPGLVDAHCHIGLGPDGPVTLDEADAQARTDRDAGALLLRDCGSPLDTTPLQARDDLPEIIRAGRHLARPKRYIRGVSDRPRRSGAAARASSPSRPRRATAGSSSWATGSTGASATSPRSGPTTCWWRPSTPRTPPGARVTAHVFGTDALPGPDQRGHRLHRARHRAHRRPDRRDGPPRHRAGAHADQRGDVPRHRRFRLALPGLRRAHARAARGGGRRRPAGGARRGCRSTRAPTRAGRSRTAGSSTRWPRCTPRATRTRVGAASWAAREWLGRPSLRAGHPADLVVYRDDPRTDPAVLARAGAGDAARPPRPHGLRRGDPSATDARTCALPWSCGIRRIGRCVGRPARATAAGSVETRDGRGGHGHRRAARAAARTSKRRAAASRSRGQSRSCGATRPGRRGPPRWRRRRTVSPAHRGLGCARHRVAPDDGARRRPRTRDPATSRPGPRWAGARPPCRRRPGGARRPAVRASSARPHPPRAAAPVGARRLLPRRGGVPAGLAVLAYALGGRLTSSAGRSRWRSRCPRSARPGWPR